MGELPARGRILGSGVIWGCPYAICWTGGGSSRLDIGHVLKEILAALFDRMDRREAEEGTQEDGLGSYKHKTPKDFR